jgi:hypothetical protein
MMAVYVEIRKNRETQNGFEYRYVASDGSVGRLELARADGSSHPIEIASGDRDEHFYSLAARKLLKHFQAGEFPDETCWAS